VKSTVAQLARMMDLSAVRADVEMAEVRRLAEVAKKYRGVSRLGVSLDSGIKILQQCAALPDGTFEV